MDSMELIAVLAAAYLLGSFPTAYLVTQWLRGEDIRLLGDGNAGATNVYASVGPVAGIVVAVVDILKGCAAVLLAYLFDRQDSAAVAAGLAVIAGHDWPLLLGFRGGNGTAPAIGALLALLPREVVAAYIIASLVFLVSRNWTLSGVLAIGSILPLAIAFDASATKALGAFLIPVAVMMKIMYQHHHSNRQRGMRDGVA